MKTAGYNTQNANNRSDITISYTIGMVLTAIDYPGSKVTGRALSRLLASLRSAQVNINRRV